MAFYMVIENFKGGDPVPVYRRFRDRGRSAPEGLTYVSSWVDIKLERCYQVMETGDRVLLDRWIEDWSDIIDFDVHEVVSSREVADKVAPACKDREATVTERGQSYGLSQIRSDQPKTSGARPEPAKDDLTSTIRAQLQGMAGLADNTNFR